MTVRDLNLPASLSNKWPETMGVRVEEHGHLWAYQHADTMSGGRWLLARQCTPDMSPEELRERVLAEQVEEVV